MSGKGLTEFMRYGWPNVYTKAYEKYIESARVDEDSFESNALLKMFGKYIYSDRETIDMVDPSGGPYLAIGNNLKHFFGDKIDRIIDKIKIGEDKITFKLK
jgi:hypothetical protein